MYIDKMSAEDDVKIDVKGLSKYFQRALDKLHTKGNYTNLAKPTQHWIKVLEEGHVTDEQWLEIFRVYEEVEQQLHPSPRKANPADVYVPLTMVAAASLLAAYGFSSLDNDTQRAIVKSINDASMNHAIRSGNRMGVLQAMHAADTLGLPVQPSLYNAPSGAHNDMARYAMNYRLLNSGKKEEGCNLQGRRVSCRRVKIRDRRSKRCRLRKR